MAASSSTRTLVVATWLLVLLGSASATLAASDDDDAGFPPPLASPAGPLRPAPRAAQPPVPIPRKILRPPGTNTNSSVFGERRPARIDEGCAGAEDIAIYQARTMVLPSGVPAYQVDVINQCIGDGCAIAGIHVRCGWFSSVVLVDPSKFRRVRHNDCLINGGKPMRAGEVVSFLYANSFPYRLSVTVATCVDPDTAAP
ncbi:hypothetical protein QOZ80_5AG0389730 [Eleusine coracana subsp. coracana]|nr:hypothetical protein QOZ80_5AG0389730 [Eleusine coracana subsp. coracana]